MINREILNDCIDKYTEAFSERWGDDKKGECFKWKMVNSFRKNWDLDAIDFVGMLKLSLKDASYLLDSAQNLPYGMLLDLAKADPVAVHQMFKKLYTENNDVVARITQFQNDAKELCAGLFPGKQDYQRSTAVSAYIWLHDPDQHIFYKYTELKRACEYLESDYKPKKGDLQNNYNENYNLVLEISKELENHKDLLALFNSLAEDDIYYKDPNHLILAHDIVIYISRVLYENGKTSEWFGEDYDSGITKDDWKKLLKDSSVFDENGLKIVKRMYDYGGQATCVQLSQKYGLNYPFYNFGSVHLAKRIYKKTGCEPYIENNGEQSFWTILYIGRRAKKGEDGVFLWKLRDELKEAIEEELKEPYFAKVSLYEYKKAGADMESKNHDISLNTILYGPPGTGKTYNTAIYAVAICDNKPLDSLTDYSAVMKRYNELKAEGRVAFTTFHQAYGYEEFIEGIKPVMKSSDGEEQSKDIKYDIMPGVFKKFCETASQKEVKTKGFEFSKDAQIWKVTIRDEVRMDCFDNNRVRIDWSIDSDGANGFVNEMSKGDIVITTDGNRKRINGIAVIVSEDAYELETNEDKTTRDVVWLAKHIDVDITEINAGRMLHRMTCSRVPKMKIEDIIAVANENNKTLGGMVVEENTKPYVFIIDEINRGNISKIFGELITLIEDKKRKGMPEGATARLPYSNDPFSVPANVYILGTMNTADRSIALMDTALRRRFQFEEKMPDASVLRRIGADKVDDLDVAAMLEKINERIEFLYDREHMIGHAFFTDLKDEPTIDRLATIFSKSVIPLLQEYFYEDYQKIQFVLGDNGKTDDGYKFIIDSAVSAKNIFKGNVDAVVDLPEKKYEINNDALYELESYKQII